MSLHKGLLIFFFQTLEKQKRKTDEEKNLQTELKRDNQSLTDACEDLERKRQKLEHDLHSKEGHVASLEGQLNTTKGKLEAEINKVCINFCSSGHGQIPRCFTNFQPVGRC